MSFESFNSILRLGKKYFLRDHPQPEYVIFQSTSKCNLYCQHCFLWQGKRKGWSNSNMGKNDLSLEEIEKISRSMEDFFFLNIGGGEPFLRPDLPQVARTFYLNNHIRNLLIPTNGTLTKTIIQKTEEILKLCPKLNISIDVSIDGIGGLHDSIRGKRGTFSKLIESFKSLKALKRKYPRLQIGTITSHMQQNEKQLQTIYYYIVTHLKPDSPTVSLTRGKPRNPVSGKIDIGAYEKLAKKMEADFLSGKVTGFRKISAWPLTVATKILMHRLVVKTWRDGYQIPCMAGRLNAVIYSNGDVYPCEMLDKDKIGNLRESGYDFPKLWQSRKAVSIRNKIRENRCYCTHECHLPINILYSPGMLPQLLWLAIKLYIR